jgi:hypothetical protein
MLATRLRYFSGRFADRTRGQLANGRAAGGSAPAPDVLLSETTGEVGHDWGFSLQAPLDQRGAVLGTLIAASAVARTHRFGPAFLWLVIPASLHAAGFADFALPAFHFQQTAIAAPAAIPLLYSGAMAVNGLGALAFGRLFNCFGADLPRGDRAGSLGTFHGLYGMARFAGSAVIGVAVRTLGFRAGRFRRGPAIGGGSHVKTGLRIPRDPLLQVRPAHRVS